MTAPVKPTAVQLLQQSTLRPTQLELLGNEVDVSDLYLALNHSDINIRDAIQDIVAERTIQGASVITVTVEDRDRVLLRSGRLTARNDIEIDGLFFRLTSVDKQAEVLTLAFEDREISVLRRYNKPIKQALSTSRHKVTRAEFILRMIREVKEEKIRYIIPELTKVQPVGKLPAAVVAPGAAANRNFGIPKDNALTVKGVQMREDQRQVANAVLNTGIGLFAPLNGTLVRKMLVMGIMCAIDESTLTNLTGGDLDSVGVFQQRASMGWPATRDVPTDATAFFTRLRTIVQATPSISYNDAIQAVQHSGTPTAYAKFRTEAERIVTAWGETTGTTADANSQLTDSLSAAQGDYEFYRGVPPTTKKASWGKESSWDAIQRLAGEVQWRAFFVSGTFYYISDDDLLKSQPVAVIDEDTVGVDAIDGDYAEGTKSATVTVTCEIARWVAPPGSVIQLKNMGPWDGRWLVNDITRSLFSTQGTITLKKKTPVLPEPAASNLDTTGTTATTYAGTPAPGSGLTPAPTTAAGKAVAAARAQIGVPYQWGGELEGTDFDCSGLTQYAYAQAGITIPRVAQQQFDFGILVQDGKLEVGDLVFFGKNSRSVEHVGIYIGNNQMINAPHTGAYVRIDSNFQAWTDPTFVGATRPSIKGKNA